MISGEPSLYARLKKYTYANLRISSTSYASTTFSSLKRTQLSPPVSRALRMNAT